VARFVGGETAAGLLELNAIAGADPGTTADLALITAHVNQRQFEAALRLSPSSRRNAG